MFLDQGKEKKQLDEISGEGFGQTEKNINNNLISLINYSILIIAILGILFGFFYFLKNDNSRHSNNDKGNNSNNFVQTAASSSKNSQLPGEYDENNKNGFDSGSVSNIKAEDLTFGHFYEEWRDDFKPRPSSYELPISIKDDVANYYDVSRKYDLDSHIVDLNNNGFAISKNISQKESNNFFDFYRALLEKDIPIVITSDFLIYYYHNNLKEVFKEIEKNVFYDNIWDISQKLYSIALVKYRGKYDEVGLSNDPVLEAYRMELAYFAVALNLMQPKEKQINREAKFSNDSKFAVQEADNYYFDMPDFLTNDVSREVELILAASAKSQKSPVFLYERNYSDFIVPAQYSKSAKLTNFYLTLKWFNSLFPMYGENDECLDCLLDEHDWLINFIAACNIAKDMADNQDIKNQWAVVYKFISFFSGLKSDLTYLHYGDVLAKLFGENYQIEDIFSNENENREQAINNIVSELKKYSFLGIEGGDARGSETSKPFIGMRMLQRLYRPNDYIFNKLTGNNMHYQSGSINRDLNITSCVSAEDKKTRYRCSGFSGDILNLIYDLNNESQYFWENIKYSGYDRRIAELKSEVEKFDKFTWNSNFYWTTLDIGRSLLAHNDHELPVYMRSNEWNFSKNINTLFGAWANIYLPGDDLAIYSEQKDINLGAYSECNLNNYIEPNFALVEELIVKNNMLIKIISSLNISEGSNAAEIQLKELNVKLFSALAIIKKELKNKIISKEDCQFISDLASYYMIGDEGKKSFQIHFPKKDITENIAGTKVLSLVYSLEDKKIMALGPVFNYSEY
ncbi:MAG: DUF3160 domain-containing protein [Patescibacteria group bacterium]|nr:DUF3160 domain-containing protein [Patescibacteria group bacterium]